MSSIPGGDKQNCQDPAVVDMSGEDSIDVTTIENDEPRNVNVAGNTEGQSTGQGKTILEQIKEKGTSAVRQPLTEEQLKQVGTYEKLEHELYKRRPPTSMVHETTMGVYWRIFRTLNPSVKGNDGKMKNCVCLACWHYKGLVFFMKNDSSTSSYMRSHTKAHHMPIYKKLQKLSTRSIYVKADVQQVLRALEEDDVEKIKSRLSEDAIKKAGEGREKIQGNLFSFMKTSKKESGMRIKNAGVDRDEADYRLVTWLVNSGRPMKMINDEYFQWFLESLNPNYVLPTYRRAVQLEENLAVYLYDKLKSCYDRSLAFFEGPFMSIQLDAWTSDDCKNYLGLATTFYRVEANMPKYFVLAVYQLVDGKKSIDLSRVIERVFGFHGFDPKYIAHSVTDGEGKNIVQLLVIGFTVGEVVQREPLRLFCT